MPPAGPAGSSRAVSPALSREREQALLAAHREGDPEAIGQLLRGYQRRIFGICYRMVRDADRASDLTQDSIVRVIQGLPGYDGRAALSTWIVRVTMNTCLSDLRKQRLRRHASLDDPDAAGVTLASRLPGTREPGGELRVEQAERDEALLRALDTLEPETRAILVLRDMQDLDYEQIGSVLDVPLGTVKSRLFRARAALRRALEEGPGDEEPERV